MSSFSKSLPYSCELQAGKRAELGKEKAKYLGHLPNGHHTIQSFLKSLIILLLLIINGKKIIRSRYKDMIIKKKKRAVKVYTQVCRGEKQALSGNFRVLC